MYTFETMSKYRYEQDHKDKPYWCVVVYYEHDDYNYDKFPNGRELTGNGLEYLTMAQAEAKAEEMNLQKLANE